MIEGIISVPGSRIVRLFSLTPSEMEEERSSGKP